jgi:hypothetical protein
MILVILAAFQLYFANRKQIQAKEAFDQAQLALNKTEETKLRVDSTANILLKITQLKLETSYIISVSTLWSETKDDAFEKLQRNLKEISFFFYPDSAQNNTYWESLEKYNPWK